MKTAFFLTSVPAANPYALCYVCDWAAKNRFKVIFINTMFVPQRIAKPGGGVGVQPIVSVYLETDINNFKKYFGFDYDIKRLPEIAEIINKRSEKNNL